MRGHPDGETITAFREDLLPARKAARIAAHLAECPRCAEVDAQLAAVTAALARTPTPPMPASLAARLDAALAAEIAARPADARSSSHADHALDAPAGRTASAAPAGPADRTVPADHTASPAARAHRGPGTGPGRAGPGHSGPGPGGPGRRAGRPRAGSRLSLRIAAAVAAVAVLAGGGYAVARVVAGGQETSSASSSTASGGSAAGGSSGAALAPEAAPRAAPTAGLPLVASGTTYRAGRLPAQVAAVLKRHPAQSHAGAAPPAAAGSGLAAFPHLAECVSHVAGGQRPRLVDVAHYGTRPAAVIVVPVPGTATVRVSVVGPGCSGQGGDIISQFSMPAPG
jgi:Putative zinc-finger